ncbi:MAG: hypothetical protein JWR08_1447 [Enterovirga sp.]|jgi:hypothetical protein|nr:hypothetical protein [Enterovirga sp.]
MPRRRSAGARGGGALPYPSRVGQPRDVMAIEQGAARKWAERVVELYAARVKMNLLQQGELERAIAARFRAAAEAGTEIEDWPPIANDALDAWESQSAGRGPRVRSFSGQSVVPKPLRV